jgi:MOSC domain-containing protein YiiM
MQSQQARVISINISPGGIPKLPRDAVTVGVHGLECDGHHHAKHNTPLQAISIIDEEDLEDLKREGFDVFPGATGENITARGLSVDDLKVGDRLRFAGGVELELTKTRKPCYVLDSISPVLKQTIVDRCGYLAKVMQEGEIRVGEAINVITATGGQR